MAGKIAVDARHLLTAFDDLDLAARVSRGAGGTEPPRALDPALLVTQVSTRFREQGDGAQLDIAMARGLPRVRLDPVQRAPMSQPPMGRGTCRRRVGPQG